MLSAIAVPRRAIASRDKRSVLLISPAIPHISIPLRPPRTATPFHRPGSKTPAGSPGAEKPYLAVGLEKLVDRDRIAGGQSAAGATGKMLRPPIGGVENVSDKHLRADPEIRRLQG